ncbi:hypothetical protein HAX54_045388 [Datura stramonium]|uniref:Uncharacterized protein n=1 Tax=Datura stramonium TaxID=4076 RepID=A0ABS8WHI7_DATST|nr:hypothetical protein [Datura stramonium]
MSAAVFSLFHQMDLLAQNGHFKANLSGKQEQVDYIPGIPPIRVLDLPTPFHGRKGKNYRIAVSKLLKDWKIGYRGEKYGHQSSITREEISSLLKWFMDSGNDEVMETRRRVKEIQKICQCSCANGGSSEINIEAFIKDVSCHKYH